MRLSLLIIDLDQFQIGANGALFITLPTVQLLIRGTKNASRNVNVSGGCCYGNYDTGPNWGGVAAGVAVGAMVGAAANSAASSPTYAAPPPTYPPGYVTPPPY